jgi:NAD(P)-dependent dehydrogenase (short-subunit alcohol dehydrogenase family)
MKLDDRVVIITGASRGIGSAIAKRFAKEGAKVVVNYNKSEDKASRLVDEIRKNGGQALAVRADVSKLDEVKQLVKKTVDAYGRVDILVNNAGVMFQKTFLDATEEIWDQTIDTNLKGAYYAQKR